MKQLISDLNDERQNFERQKKAYENEKYMNQSEFRSLNDKIIVKQRENEEL